MFCLGLISDSCDLFTRRNVCLTFIFLFSFPYIICAQSPSHRQVPRLKGYLGSPYGFWEYVPAHYETQEKLPVVIYLHGIKETGSGTTEADLHKVLLGGPPSMIAKLQKDFPFILISPQSPGLDDGFAPEKLEQLVQIIKTKYKTDVDRIYITGLSYGAYATWSFATHAPGEIAAIVPISSCGNIARPELLKNLPIWAFVNSGDYAVPGCMYGVVEKIRNAGGNPLFTIYQGDGHNAWTNTYSNPKMWDWLLAQHRSPAKENQAPVFVTLDDQVVTIGYPRTIEILATDRNNDKLTFVVESALPPGVTFSTERNGHGMLTVKSQTAGEHPIIVSVTDGKGQKVTCQFTLTTKNSPLVMPILLLFFLQPLFFLLPAIRNRIVQLLF